MRNLHDWIKLVELLDRGIELHFAHESFDLSSRGGRLSANIQVVIAADHVRDLRDELKEASMEFSIVSSPPRVLPAERNGSTEGT